MEAMLKKSLGNAIDQQKMYTKFKYAASESL